MWSEKRGAEGRGGEDAKNEMSSLTEERVLSGKFFFPAAAFVLSLVVTLFPLCSPMSLPSGLQLS